MDHDSITKDWQQNAESQDSENYEFLRSMKFQDYGFDPDELAGKLHQQVFNIVDCTRCANCCKTMDIVLSPEDVERIAMHLNMATDEFTHAYMMQDNEEGPYKARRKPCPFLGKDDCCTIYDVCGRWFVESIPTQTKRALHSDQWVLPVML